MDIEAQLPACPCGSGLPVSLCCSQDLSAVTPVLVCSEPVAAALREAVDVFNRGDRARATDTCLALLRDQPGLVTALHILADIRQTERVFTAELALRRRIVSLAPDDVPQLVRFVTTLIERGDKDEALAFARRAVWMDGEDARAHWLIAMAFVHLEYNSDAEYHFDRALALTPTPSPDLLLTVADHMRTHGRLERARALIAQAEATTGPTLRSVISLANVETMAGNLDEATALANRAVRDWPNSPAHRQMRAMIAEERHDYAGALAILNDETPELAFDQSVQLLLTRGRLLGELGRTDEAFADFAAGKALEAKTARQAFRPEVLERTVTRMRSMLTPRVMGQLPCAPASDGLQPLFITGFPRSGTTLIEQILSMHPLITPGGELRATSAVVARAAGVIGSRMSFPDALIETLVADRRHALTLLRDLYLSSAMPDVTPREGAIWFTDKSLMQEANTPLRALLFPSSPIINTVRHPLDSLLSVFSHHFPAATGYATDIERLAWFYRMYAEAAEQWRLTLPNIRYLRVRHEDMVADQEGQTRRLLDFVGVPFDPACLEFHRNPRVAPTISFSQVREAITPRRLYRYRPYLKHLAPALPILEPVIAMLGYTIEE